MSMMEAMLRRIVPHGWHVDLYLPADSLDALGTTLDALPVPYVLDHIELVDAGCGPDQPAFRALAHRYATDRKCWVKVTCPERLTVAGAPYHDVVPFAQRLIEIDPDRLLWAERQSDARRRRPCRPRAALRTRSRCSPEAACRRGEREPAFVRGRGQDFCYATPVHPATGMDNDVTFLPT